MDLFANRFGLPISWPLQRLDFASYGWVTLGNTNLEFWAASDNSDLSGDQVLPLFHGFALDPEDLRKSIDMLESRGIQCKTPRSYITKNAEGRDLTNFTNAVILDVSGESCCIFFCKWGIEGTIFPWAENITAMERQVREQSQLSACAGGKLGITGLVEIRMTTPNIPEAAATWGAIAGQISASIILANGIKLRLIPGNDNKIESLVIGVRSLAAARSALAEMDILGAEDNEEITLSGRACSDLRFRFREDGAA